MKIIRYVLEKIAKKLKNRISKVALFAEILGRVVSKLIAFDFSASFVLRYSIPLFHSHATSLSPHTYTQSIPYILYI